MSDRAAFLTAITLVPEDDVPRLVYADWLDEQESPADRAHAAFIRLGCNLDAAKKRQTPAEGRWLEVNWKLLAPDLVADGFLLHRRYGRTIHFKKVETVTTHCPPFTDWPNTYKFSRWVLATFWRGFVSRLETYQSRDLASLALAARSQPLAELAVQDCVLTWDNGAEVHQRVFDWPGVIPDNDVWQRMTGFNHVMNGYDGLPLSKRFNGRDAHARCRKSLADALRGWVDSARHGV